MERVNELLAVEGVDGSERAEGFDVDVVLRG